MNEDVETLAEALHEQHKQEWNITFELAECKVCEPKAAALAPLLDAAQRKGARAGAAICICSEDAYNAVGCSCHAEERRAHLATYDPWGRAAAAAFPPDTESEERA